MKKFKENARSHRKPNPSPTSRSPAAEHHVHYVGKVKVSSPSLTVGIDRAVEKLLKRRKKLKKHPVSAPSLQSSSNQDEGSSETSNGFLNQSDQRESPETGDSAFSSITEAKLWSGSDQPAGDEGSERTSPSIINGLTETRKSPDTNSTGSATDLQRPLNEGEETTEVAIMVTRATPERNGLIVEAANKKRERAAMREVNGEKEEGVNGRETEGSESPGAEQRSGESPSPPIAHASSPTSSVPTTSAALSSIGPGIQVIYTLGTEAGYQTSSSIGSSASTTPDLPRASSPARPATSFCKSCRDSGLMLQFSDLEERAVSCPPLESAVYKTEEVNVAIGDGEEEGSEETDGDEKEEEVDVERRKIADALKSPIASSSSTGNLLGRRNRERRNSLNRSKSFEQPRASQIRNFAEHAAQENGRAKDEVDGEFDTLPELLLLQGSQDFQALGQLSSGPSSPDSSRGCGPERYGKVVCLVVSSVVVSIRSERTGKILFRRTTRSIFSCAQVSCLALFSIYRS